MKFAAMVFLGAWMCVAWPAPGADRPLVVELWPGAVPDETGDIGPERARLSPKLDRKQVEVTEQTQLITGVPAELHVYANTTHDFGVRASDRPYSKWTEACAHWLRDQGLLAKAMK